MSRAALRAWSGVSVDADPSTIRRFETLRPRAPGRYSTHHVFPPAGRDLEAETLQFAVVIDDALVAGLMVSTTRLVSFAMGMKNLPGRHRVATETEMGSTFRNDLQVKANEIKCLYNLRNDWECSGNKKILLVTWRS